MSGRPVAVERIDLHQLQVLVDVRENTTAIAQLEPPVTEMRSPITAFGAPEEGRGSMTHVVRNLLLEIDLTVPLCGHASVRTADRSVLRAHS